MTASKNETVIAGGGPDDYLEARHVIFRGTNREIGRAIGEIARTLRDPDGANLDRVPIVKGWLDASGELHEEVIDVACSDDRRVRNNRCERPVGNTVDVAEASYTNTIGDALLFGYWSDPDFDPSDRAFYYVRVVEIPTPTWLVYDRAFYGIDLPDDAVLVHQERAYTSPIWYTP